MPKSKSQTQKPYKTLRFQLFNPEHQKKDLKDVLGPSNAFKIFKNEVEKEKESSNDQINPDSSFSDSSSYDEEKSTAKSEKVLNEEKSIGKLMCTTCNVNFSNLTEQRDHFRLDWHRYNLKRRLNKVLDVDLGPVSQEEFENLIDGLSTSISGSDSSSDEDEEKEADNSDKLKKLVERIELKEQNENILGGFQVLKKEIKSPKIFFENSENGKVFCMFKSIIPDDLTFKNESSDEGRNMSHLLLNSFCLSQLIDKPETIAIIMASGGHFAAAVFEGSEPKLHKTFHSYTVRAKQGGTQSSRDNKNAKSHPKSAGSNLRRYNEASFIQHIQDLFETNEWKTALQNCHKIFYRAHGQMKRTLFDKKMEILSKEDEKLHKIPFTVKRPTFKEAKNVYYQLTTISMFNLNREELLKIFETPEPKPTKVTTSPGNKQSPKKKKKLNIDRAKSRSPKRNYEEVPEEKEYEIDDDDDEGDDGVLEESIEIIDTVEELQEFGDSLHNNKRRRKKKAKKKVVEDQNLVLKGILPEIVSNIKKDPLDVNQMKTFFDNLIAELQNGILTIDDLNEVIMIDLRKNLLHVVTELNLLDFVWILLDLGCRPELKDKLGKYPYNYAKSKECKNVFRRFRAEFPDKYDYTKAQIPAPLTEDLEKEQVEKKKLQNKLKRDKEKIKKQEFKEKKTEIEEKDRFLNLSDREKRALAAERRILGQCKRNGEQKPILVRCFECAKDITGAVPFEYNKNLFCTPPCLKEHRKKFPVPLSL